MKMKLYIDDLKGVIHDKVTFVQDLKKSLKAASISVKMFNPGDISLILQPHFKTSLG